MHDGAQCRRVVPYKAMHAGDRHDAGLEHLLVVRRESLVLRSVLVVEKHAAYFVQEVVEASLQPTDLG